MSVKNTASLLERLYAELDREYVSITLTRDTKEESIQVSAVGEKLLKAKLLNSILNIKGIQTAKGSDSFVDIKKKEALEAIMTPFKKIKKSKVKHGKTKVKHKKTIVSKASKGKSKEATTINVLKIITEINKALPEAIRANMGTPALVNRTGRFSESVRVTDIAITPGGFPSLGYTYQTDPYKVFEATSGTRFSSTDRDPRILINKTIREIASLTISGRFFTRRV